MAPCPCATLRPGSPKLYFSLSAQHDRWIQTDLLCALDWWLGDLNPGWARIKRLQRRSGSPPTSKSPIQTTNPRNLKYQPKWRFLGIVIPQDGLFPVASRLATNPKGPPIWPFLETYGLDVLFLRTPCQGAGYAHALPVHLGPAAFRGPSGHGRRGQERWREPTKILLGFSLNDPRKMS